VPGLTEKCLLLASAGEWDQALDTAQRALDLDEKNFDALKVVAVHAFTQDGHADEAVQKFEDLHDAIMQREPNSADIQFRAAEIFSRICCRHQRAIQLCQALLERATSLAPTNAKYFCELGHILTIGGQYQSAMKMFKESSRKDSNSFNALEGMILCQLIEGQLDDAEAQIELLGVMHGSDSDEALGAGFSYLQAILALRKRRDMRAHLEKLDEAQKVFFQQASETQRSRFQPPLQELVIMNPDFLLQLGVAYMTHLESPLPASLSGGGSAGAPSSPSKNGSAGGLGVTSGLSKPAPAVESGMHVLQRVMKLMPGMTAVYIEMSRVQLAMNKHEEAYRLLRQCLQINPNCSAGLIAMAKVELSRDNASAANRALEQALSSDFSIRSVLLFQLVQAQVRAQQGKTDEAIADLETITNLPEFKSGGAGQFGRMSTDSLRLTEDDVASAFVVLASMLSRSGRHKEARKVLSNAKVMFAGTNQEVQVLVASSQLAVERNDFDTAIRTLDKIQDDSPTFIRAQMIKAEILLNQCHDKEGYTKCYQKLVNIFPSAKTYSLLGEAFIRILNPEAAVGAFKQAYKLDTRNVTLRARIGKSLVATHEYHQAIEFYESSLRDMSVDARSETGGSLAVSGETVPLAHDLAKLYIKLDRMESASRVLTRILHNDDCKDITDMKEDVETLRLLAKVQIHNGQSVREVVGTLTRAQELQRNVVNTMRGSSIASSEAIEAERQILSELCEAKGRCYVEEDNSDESAETFLNEALQHNPHNVKAMYALAKLKFRRGENDQCAIQCNKILSANSSDEAASVMLADILFKTEDSAPGACLEPLQRLLIIHPNNYKALEKLLVYLRRLGRLEEAPPFMESAEKSDRRSGTHAGLHYCKGLYQRYTNDVTNAVIEFNLARKDSEWGPDSIMHMIELYLNPDHDNVWEDKEGSENEEAYNMTEEFADNIHVAQALLAELRPLAK
jgi:tetratricopeptide repeat protein 21B